MDGGAWWAAVYGVAQSRSRLKRLSSSSRDNLTKDNILFCEEYGTRPKNHFFPVEFCLLLEDKNIFNRENESIYLLYLRIG